MSKNIKKGDYLDILLKSDKTVFSTKDISLLWNEENSASARNRLNDYVENNKLIRLRRGLYAKDENYNRKELATKIFTPSYVSFETVLFDAGIVFQVYKRIFVASYLTREVEVDNQIYEYRKLKDRILTNKKGIIDKDNSHVASPERAFLDVVYSNKGYHFDDLSSLDWDKVFEILPIYENKAMEKRVKDYKNNA